MVTAPPSAPPAKPPVSRLPPPTPAPVASTASSRTHDIAARLREAAAGTPGTMRLLGVGTVIVLVVFGVLGALSANSRAGAIDDARDQAAQFVRLQTVRTNLVQADALATNAFLVAGLESAGQREAYTAGIAAATAALTDAAAHSDDADADELRRVNAAIVEYSGLIESARANNRQGFPVGVAYLKQASSLLRVDEQGQPPSALTTLSDLSDTTQARVKDAYRDSRTSTDWLVAGAAIGIVAVVITQGYLTVRTRRLLSVPLLVAGGIVVVSTVVAAGVMAWSQAQADDVRDGNYRDTVALGQARVFAFDAKSAESFTLILRGSGQASEQQFQSLSDAAVATLQGADVQPEHATALAAYIAAHQEIRTADDGGDWDGAVALATQADGASATAFEDFSISTNAELTDTASGISDDLDDARFPLPALAIVLVLAGIAAAIAAWQGVAARLKEYR